MKRLSENSAPGGFTLVEMLVVITIIGILAGLVTAAALSARNRARIAVISLELNQLDMALKAYKEKFGEYPPDFAGVNITGTTGDAARNAVLRHLAKAFPRYVPAGNDIKTRWDNFANDCSTWNVNPSNFGDYGPFFALTFWLGGRAVDVVTGTVTGFSGFSANPQNPFDITTPSRIGPFFEFDLSRVSISTTNGNGIRYWPSNAEGDKIGGAIVYFRAENGVYRYGGVTNALSKRVTDTTGIVVYPAGDTRLGFSTTAGSNSWINPRSFQILSSGMDVTYGSLTSGSDTVGLAFPDGTNYADETFDDITNFSGGTLEDAIP